MTSYEYRLFLTRNADSIMAKNREMAEAYATRCDGGLRTDGESFQVPPPNSNDGQSKAATSPIITGFDGFYASIPQATTDL